MNRETLDYMLDEIYGAFDRKTPLYGSPAYRAIEKRVDGERPLPDECAPFIAEALQNYSSLPTNLGKAIMDEFFNWLDKNPKKRAAPFSCPECSRGMHGFFWAWEADGAPYCLKCACNLDSRFANLPAFTRKKAREAGYLLECPITAPPPGKPDVSRFLGQESPRPAHLRQMEEEWR